MRIIFLEFYKQITITCKNFNFRLIISLITPQTKTFGLTETRNLTKLLVIEYNTGILISNEIRKFRSQINKIVFQIFEKWVKVPL